MASAFIDAFALAWVEELHPRDTSGRFTDGSDVREDHPKSAPPTEPQTSDAKPVLAPAPAPLPAVVEKAVETDENTLGALRGHEEAFVVDASGKEVMHLTGTVDSIPVTEDMDHGLLKDAVFTHNHPGVYAYGGVVNGLSVEDVVTAAKHDVLEMRAVSDGVVHVIERPEKGWPSTVALQEAAKAESDKIYADFSTRIAKGEAQIDQARQQHYHILWNRLAPEFGFRYAREVRPGATARILDVPAEMSLSSRSAGKLIDDSELAEMDARYLALAGKAVSLAAGFDETAHPRDEHGRWASKDDDDDVPLLSASDNPRSVVTRTADGAKLTIRTPGGADVDDLLPLTHDLPTTIAKKWFAGTSADGVQVDMKWDRWHYTSPEHPNDPVATLAISAKGGPFAHVERTISKLADGSVWVNHDKLFVEPDQQGHSLGVRLIDNAFRWYRTLGEHVTVTAFANATRGAYAWARGGFVPVKDDHLADTLKEIGKRVTALRVSADIKERLRSALNPDDKQALWKVADARWYGQNIGKQLLEGLSWNAEMRLDDKTQMDRWNRYVASKLPEKSRG